MTKKDIENFIIDNKNVIVTTKVGSIIGVIESIDDNVIKLKVAQCSYITPDEATELEYAIISINKVLSICSFTLDESKLPEN